MVRYFFDVPGKEQDRDGIEFEHDEAARAYAMATYGEIFDKDTIPADDLGELLVTDETGTVVARLFVKGSPAGTKRSK